MAIVTAIASVIKKLSALKFFGRPEQALSAWGVVWWWESRRVAFNLIVGTAGLITCAMLFCCAMVAERYLDQPIGMSGSPIGELVAAIFYGVAANVAYTGGSATELVVRGVWGDPGRSFSRVALVLGLLFSVFLTLVPVLVVGAVVLVELGLHAVRVR